MVVDRCLELELRLVPRSQSGYSMSAAATRVSSSVWLRNILSGPDRAGFLGLGIVFDRKNLPIEGCSFDNFPILNLI